MPRVRQSFNCVLVQLPSECDVERPAAAPREVVDVQRPSSDTPGSTVEHRRPERRGTKSNAPPMATHGCDRTEVIDVKEFMRMRRKVSLSDVVQGECPGDKGEDDGKDLVW